MTSQEMIELSKTKIDEAEKYTHTGSEYKRYIAECREAMLWRLHQVEHTSWWGTDVEGQMKRSLAFPLAEIILALTNPLCTMREVEDLHNIILKGGEHEVTQFWSSCSISRET